MRSHDRSRQPTLTLVLDESSLRKHSSCGFIGTIARCDPEIRGEGVPIVRQILLESCFPIARVGVLHDTRGIRGDFQANKEG